MLSLKIAVLKTFFFYNNKIFNETKFSVFSQKVLTFWGKKKSVFSDRVFNIELKSHNYCLMSDCALVCYFQTKVR